MPDSEDATISSLVNALREDDERSRAAWLQLREILRAEPERVAARLCTLLDECLASGTASPDTPSIIATIFVCTKHQPALVPESVLRSLLPRAEPLGHLSLLCLATMLARVCPQGMLTEGIFQVLVASEHALTSPRAESDRKVQQYAKEVALELWHTVGAHDAASVVALLEAWAAKAGWQRHLSHLFAEILLKEAPRQPHILDDTIALFEAIQAREQQSPGELEPPDRVLKELKRLGETFRRKAVAERIAKEALLARLPREPAPSSPHAGKTPIVAPDIRVDRLIEEYLVRPDYEKRMREAERRIETAMRTGSMADVRREDINLIESEPPGQRLLTAMSNPYPALVQGVCELVDELVAANPTDERIEMLVSQLCLGLRKHPDLVPLERFRRWVANDAAFGDQVRARLYAVLATVCPDWIVDHKFADAACVSIAATASDFFSEIGQYDAGLLLEFVERYLTETVWDSDTVPKLLREMEKVARQHPEKAAAMIAVTGRLRGEPPKPDVIDFRYIELSKALESLRSVGEKSNP
jgi:hypothetical protein